MGWAWFGSQQPKESEFFRDEFKPLYSAFVDAMIDSMHAGAPTVSAPCGAEDTPSRQQRVWPAVPRLVAIGDIHGDLEKMKQALTISGLIDADFHWAGGSAVMVQVRGTTTRLSGLCGTRMQKANARVVPSLLPRCCWPVDDSVTWHRRFSAVRHV